MGIFKKRKFTIAYNEDSFVNNSTVRWLNNAVLVVYAVFAILQFASSWSEGIPQMEFLNTTPYSIEVYISASISISMITKVLQETEFFEWDSTERKKKVRFTIRYARFNFVFSALFVHEIFFAVYNYRMFDHISLIIIEIFMVLYFLFNLCNIVGLHFSYFEQDLAQSWETPEKPDNWQE